MNEEANKPVLFIGGMDSSGGAGLLRDAATAAELSAAARVAVTAVTAQSNSRVAAIHPVPPATVAAQIALAAETPLAAVKIGMLGTGGIVRAVAAALAPVLPGAPLVLDPVLGSSSGRALIDGDGIRTLVASLLPRTALLTPNLPELRALAAPLGLPPEAAEGAIARALLERGCKAVLVKGGHAEKGPVCEDRLHLPGGRIARFAAPRFDAELRGTGCQLASAIAVQLARGKGLETAVALARETVQARFARHHRRAAAEAPAP